MRLRIMCAFTALSSSIYPHFSFSFSPFPHSFLSLLLFSLVGVFVSGGACYVPPPLQFPVSGPTLFSKPNKFLPSTPLFPLHSDFAALFLHSFFLSTPRQVTPVFCSTFALLSIPSFDHDCFLV
ncbi:hypothetical protein AFLA70_84g002780 [Aspergillus flavus AF70]|nr:hypothetical protein AFLA70_84g002780 [Aspergillus flavus AF70]